MQENTLMDLETIYSSVKEPSLHGRYITNEHISPLIAGFSNVFSTGIAGYSVDMAPIYKIVAGFGKTKIFMWSQMHGNESTTTKAIFDFLNFLQSDAPLAKAWMAHFTFCILPILNPDGAVLYTRENASKVDLNRDSVNLSQPESRLLRQVFEEFKPDFCFNMHDQRTIFGVGESPVKPATVSFLAPSYNDARDVNECRQVAINLIAAINDALQKHIPGQVGRFDDSFNINCIGDMFQSLGVPTVLFEAGHYQQDYEREVTRKMIFFALFSGFLAIYENVIAVNRNGDYFNIPQNKNVFYDIMYKNIKINYENKEKITNFASQYREVLIDKSVIFRAFISEIGNLESYNAHEEIDCLGEEFWSEETGKTPKTGKNADFSIGKNRKIVNGVEIF